MILEPKLGKLPKITSWAESNFAEEEIVMHAKPDWLPPGTRTGMRCSPRRCAKAWKDGKAPADVAQWSYGSWHVIDLEHPLAPFLP